MIKVSFKTFLDIIYDTISSSPTTLITIVVGIVFLISMILSIKRTKKMSTPLFICGWVFVLLFLILKYSSYLTTLLDNLINNIFMQIFFPNFAIYVIMIVVANIIFLGTILNSRSTGVDKILNLLFYIILIVLLIMILEQVTSNNINVYDKLTVYSDATLLVLIQCSTLFFTLWMIIILCKKIIRKIIKKSDDKVREKFVPKSSGVEVLKL